MIVPDRTCLFGSAVRPLGVSLVHQIIEHELHARHGETPVNARVGKGWLEKNENKENQTNGSSAKDRGSRI